MCALEVTDLTRRIGDNLILDRVSFRIEDGEFFVLLGPSGSGKSTLLRLITGIERPDGGRIVIDGQDVTASTPQARNLGMVFQDYGLYPNMNVTRNIAYGLEARGMARQDVERRVAESAAMFGLSDMLDRQIGDLSGGEQQRVALARAVAKDAAAYLFDEPLSNLDPKLRYQARKDIVALHQKKLRPSLYVTHDQAEAFAMGDRVGLLVAGRLLQAGHPHELIDHPVSTSVASFVGTPPMNLLTCPVRVEGSTVRVQAGDQWLNLSGPLAESVARLGKRTVILGIRPDALGLDAAAAPEGHALSLTGRVQEIESLIVETLVFLDLGQGVQCTAMLDDSAPDRLHEGDVAFLSVDLTRLVAFDPDSEIAL